jgi:hypothetical protein
MAPRRPFARATSRSSSAASAIWAATLRALTPVRSKPATFLTCLWRAFVPRMRRDHCAAQRAHLHRMARRRTQRLRHLARPFFAVSDEALLSSGRRSRRTALSEPASSTRCGRLTVPRSRRKRRRSPMRSSSCGSACWAEPPADRPDNHNAAGGGPGPCWNCALANRPSRPSPMRNV